MDRKERICAYISSKEYIPLNLEELMTVLDVPSDAEDELRKILDDLCAEGRIYITKKLRYMPSESKKDTAEGRLSCSANGYFGFVAADDGDVFVHGDNMNGAIHGDTVVVRIDESSDSRREGRVIRIAERGNTTIIGTLTDSRDGFFRLIPDSRRIYKRIYVHFDDAMDAAPDSRVATEIVGYDEDFIYGRVISVLGDKEQLSSYTEGIIAEHGIKQEFDAETLDEADSAPASVCDKDIEGRSDFRDKLIFTIDGDDARDFDDAVSLEMLDNGNYFLGVHIADVTHYVKEGGALDREALFRGTSVYLADRVIPMLPERLSNGICSLNPHEDRLTLSVLMEIDKSGSVLSHSIERSVINSKERMTYNNVTRLIEGDTELTEWYGYLLPTLLKMKELSDILEKMRSLRGAIDFDFPETKVLLDENKEPVDIVPEERGISNKIIEEFMLTANETVAEYAYWSELPFVYRTHEPPSEEKINAFGSFIAYFGISLKGKIDKDNPVHTKTLQKILEKVKGTPEERMVSSTMLHSLMKAEYKPENLGHFGLCAKYYCHFTSPIRRYPDLIIHRILKEFLDGGLSAQRREHYEQFCSRAAVDSTDAEINAEHTERDVDDLMKTAYMSSFVGGAFKAVVANVTNFGMFVELENSVEGLIRLENMNEDYFEYNETSSALEGKRTGTVYKIGDEVSVVLMRADILSRQLDFVLEWDANSEMFGKFKKEKRKTTINKQKSNFSRKRFVKRRRKGR